jgi:carbon storage regulator
MVGSNVVVTVLEIRGDTVKLGFNAPGEVQIHREEVRRRIEAEDLTSQEFPATLAPLPPQESLFFGEFA